MRSDPRLSECDTVADGMFGNPLLRRVADADHGKGDQNATLQFKRGQARRIQSWDTRANNLVSRGSALQLLQRP